LLEIFRDVIVALIKTPLRPIIFLTCDTFYKKRFLNAGPSMANVESDLKNVEFFEDDALIENLQKFDKK
jgi:hypothetical protein